MLKQVSIAKITKEDALVAVLDFVKSREQSKMMLGVARIIAKCVLLTWNTGAVLRLFTVNESRVGHAVSVKENFQQHIGEQALLKFKAAVDSEKWAREGHETSHRAQRKEGLVLRTAAP